MEGGIEEIFYVCSVMVNMRNNGFFDSHPLFQSIDHRTMGYWRPKLTGDPQRFSKSNLLTHKNGIKREKADLPPSPCLKLHC